MQKLFWRDLLIIVVIALIGRTLLMLSGAVSFHSDEAVVALMARHINQGARPVFFYGQAYMGSLDAWLVAAGFRLFGESVLSIRIVQSVLYGLVVITAYLVAWELSGKRTVAAVTGLIFALPSALVATYTTATLGGYNEVLLLGNLILIAGYRVLHSTIESRRLGAWALLGLCAGLGWWANGLIVMYVLPVALLGLFELIRRVRQRSDSLAPFITGIFIATAAFLIGSAPWWMYNFEHDFAALRFYLTGDIDGVPDPGGIKITFGERVLGMLLFGLPVVFGMRFSWLPTYFLMPVGLVTLSIYLIGIYRLARANPLRPGARRLVLLMIGLFLLIFMLSPFGGDPTGRYFLPLVLPLGIVLGAFVETTYDPSPLSRWGRRALPIGIAALVLGYQLAGQITGAAGEYGLTTQFDLITHIPPDHDAEVIEFLLDNNLHSGHTNYWVAYRLAFLSGEQLQYSASLPYKAELTYNPADKRYPPYTEAAAAAERIAYITTRLPALDEQLESAFAAAGITYDTITIGDYHIYYNFSTTPRLTLFGL